MGIINQGILGGDSSTVGNVVGRSRKRINYIRIKADHYTNANSESQVKQRTKFSACIILAKSVLDNHPSDLDQKSYKDVGIQSFL